VFLTARRMAGSKVYHVNGPVWLHTGAALCGFDTTRAAYVMYGSDLAALRNVAALHGRQICKHCAAHVQAKENAMNP
jgi:hypothetical protein